MGGGGGRCFDVMMIGASHKGMDHFYGGSWPLKTQRKDFDLAIRGGLGWINGWLDEISIMKKQNNNKNVKLEKIVVLVKTFDHHKFQLFQLSCKIVKEFETET